MSSSIFTTRCFSGFLPVDPSSMVDRGRREFEYIHHQREREHWYKQGCKRRWQGLLGYLPRSESVYACK